MNGHYGRREAFSGYVEVVFNTTDNHSYSHYECPAPIDDPVIILLDVDSFDVQVHGAAEGYPVEALQYEPFVVVNDSGV